MSKARDIADLGSNDVLETTATGVDVTGTVQADGLDLPNGGFLNSARNSGSLSLPILGHPSGSDTVRYLSSDGHSFVNGSLTKALQIANNGDVSFYEDTGTTAKMVWDASAEELEIGSSTDKLELGASFQRFRKGNENKILIGNTSSALGSGTGLINYLYDPEPFIWYQGAERMRIDSSGNVGIGTASPSATLSIKGSTGFTGLDIADGTDRTILGYHVSDGFRITNVSAKPIVFKTSDAERARIDSSGNFGIGTSNPNYKLVVSDSGGAGLEVIPQTSNNRVTLLSYDRANTAYRQINFDGSESIFYTGGTERVRIASNGNLLVGTANSPSITHSLSVAGRMFSAGTYANNSGAGANLGISSSGEIYRSTSSLRYKTDVQDAQHGLTEVMTLRPVTYRGINDGDTVFGGLIAEEVHDAGLTEFVEYNEDNEPDALAYANMVSLCIKAIQEQQEIIENLKSRIETLENN